MSLVARDTSRDNIFKSMKVITFEQTISHQCGVTMNDSVEARAIAEFISRKPGVTVTYAPAMIRIDGNGKLMSDDVNDRVASAPIPPRQTSTVIGIAKGKRKFEAIKAAVTGHQINGLITDEAVAEYLLKD